MKQQKNWRKKNFDDLREDIEDAAYTSKEIVQDKFYDVKKESYRLAQDVQQAADDIARVVSSSKKNDY